MIEHMNRIFKTLAGVAMAALCMSACTEKQTLTLSGLDPQAFVGEKDGKATALYTLTNANGMEVCVTNFGGRIVSVMVPDKDGNMVSLSDFKGKKVVLYFYPRDNTPGCTRQACAFAQNYGAFEEKGVVVIGVSKDSVASHVKFAEKHQLPFILISDPELVAIQGYDVWKEKKSSGKVTMGVVRTTYIIDEEGIIEKVMPKVKPDTNANEILEWLGA